MESQLIKSLRLPHLTRLVIIGANDQEFQDSPCSVLDLDFDWSSLKALKHLVLSHFKLDVGPGTASLLLLHHLTAVTLHYVMPESVASLERYVKSNPRQFWRKASLPHNMLPPELQTPSAWDGYLANLTAPPVHIADQLPLPHTPQPPAPATSLDHPLTQAEIEVALQKLHNGRSGALLGYTSELLRYAKLTATDEDPAPEHLLVPCLQLLFNTAFSTGSVPQSWKTSLVTPIFKKGDATDTANYRPIAVGEPLSRLYASILVQRLVHFTQQHDLRSPTQAGYRPEHSTIHQAFVLQHVIDKHRCLKTPLYLCFVDLKSAYDRVQWPLLWDLLLCWLAETCKILLLLLLRPYTQPGHITPPCQARLSIHCYRPFFGLWQTHCTYRAAVASVVVMTSGASIVASALLRMLVTPVGTLLQ